MTRYVLACGGRDFSDRDRVFTALDGMHDEQRIVVLIHGGAAGADSLAGEWAKERGIHQSVYRAQWGSYRNAAGPIRNQLMLDEGKPDVVVAFPGGAGTADMVRRALAAGVRVVQVYSG